MEKIEKTYIEPAEVPWSHAVVMICEKCARRSDDDKFSSDLKSELKAKLKDEGYSKQVRVITTSCLNVCPKNRVAVAVASNQKVAFQAYAIKLKPNSALDLYAEILGNLKH